MLWYVIGVVVCLVVFIELCLKGSWWRWVFAIALVVVGVKAVFNYNCLPPDSVQCRIEGVSLPEYTYEDVLIVCRPQEDISKTSKFWLSPAKFPAGFDARCYVDDRDCGCLKTRGSWWWNDGHKVEMVPCDQGTKLDRYQPLPVEDSKP